MEARLADALPAGGQWQFEPKWDGFRCLVFKDGDTVALQSKSGQPLGRYFPELVAAAAALPVRWIVLDGEIVIPDAGGGTSFESLLQRIHPAESRIRRLAAETPARLLAFDLLVDGRGASLMAEPLEARRAALEREQGALFSEREGARRPGEPITLSPVTRDRRRAEAWLAGRDGTDGVVAKLLGEPYRSGERTAMVKVKRARTADCVVAGFRRGKDGREVASLLLGLYADDGLLHYAGHASAFSRAERDRLTRIVEPLVAPSSFTGDAPGGPSRWARGRSMEWTPVRPVLVVEVEWRHASGGRFRHGVRLMRFRPDKAPEQCTFQQIERPEAGGPAAAPPEA